jgi:hypothetical protein
MADLVLRLTKTLPLTDAELDQNFTNLNRDTYLSTRNSIPWVASTAFSSGRVLNVDNRFYLVTTAGTTGASAPVHTSGSTTNGTATLQYHIPTEYSARDILAKIITVDGTGSGLDADMLNGRSHSVALPAGADKTSIVSRDSSGNFAANTITANLTGNVTGNTTGTHTGPVVGNADTATLATTASNANLLNNLSSTQILQLAEDSALALAIALG